MNAQNPKTVTSQKVQVGSGTGTTVPGGSTKQIGSQVIPVQLKSSQTQTFTGRVVQLDAKRRATALEGATISLTSSSYTCSWPTTTSASDGTFALELQQLKDEEIYSVRLDVTKSGFKTRSVLVDVGRIPASGTRILGDIATFASELGSEFYAFEVNLFDVVKENSPVAEGKVQLFAGTSPDYTEGV